MSGRGSKFSRAIRGHRWDRVRLETLNAANWRCSKCQAYGNEVHHVKPLHLGGAPYDHDNLQVLCRTHHIDLSRKPRDPAREAWATYIHQTFHTGGSNHDQFTTLERSPERDPATAQ